MSDDPLLRTTDSRQIREIYVNSARNLYERSASIVTRANSEQSVALIRHLWIINFFEIA